MDLKDYIKTVSNFPKEGIEFRDITSLLLNPEALHYVEDKFEEFLNDRDFDCIVALESRGFIFAAPLALALNKPLVLIRKAGKLPRETYSESYDLEYGSETIEVHKEDISLFKKAVIVDDLLATGGTVQATINLLSKANVAVDSCLFVINLPELEGENRLKEYNPYSLVNYSGK